MAEKQTCADIYFCRGAKTGICDHAKILDGQADVGQLSQEAAQELLNDEKENVRPLCVLPEQLDRAIEDFSKKFSL